MAAYFIADIEVKDPTAFGEYRKQVPATIEKYGGRYLARGGATEVLEGEWRPRRVVILEFPGVAAARRWYDSDEYREPKALRRRAAVTNLVLVEGL